MAGDGEVKEFPDVTQKLSAPKKLSAFEKDRQAAETKRLRAEAENAAALRAFEDSFADDDDDPIAAMSRGGGPPMGPRGGGVGYGGGQGDRHGDVPPFGPRTGPGSLGPAPGVPPPPPSLKRKRALEEAREAMEARREQETLNDNAAPQDGSMYSPHQPMDDDEQDTETRPTIQLSSLPPDAKSSDVQNLLRGHLKVHSVDFLPPVGPGYASSRSMTAIATLAAETEKSQIDSAITALRDKYIGCGYRLSISQHLSSTTLHPSMSTTMSGASSEPFGAERPRMSHGRGSMRNAPPPSDFRGGFAPPASYDNGPRSSHGMLPVPEALVSVQVPLDVPTIQAIHILAERLILEPSLNDMLEIEASLMSDPVIKMDEHFAFLYDSRCPAGVYYRYLLWRPNVDAKVQEAKRRAKGLERVYSDAAFQFAPPYGQLPFPDMKSLSEAVTDIDYNSSEEESDDDSAERRFNNGRDLEQAAPLDSPERSHLSPLKRARLTHLLSRLPTTNSRLRKGDVARITNFAITHAGTGADEIADLLLLNVEKPFSYSLAAKYEDPDPKSSSDTDYEPGDSLPSVPDDDGSNNDSKKVDDDGSNAKLIALYLISDLLSASSTAGAKNAWKYRQLFETGFKVHGTFERLGRLDRELKWGRLKAEQWKRKVGTILGIWENWSAFSPDVQAELSKSFYEPPLTEREREEERRKEQAAAAAEKRKGKVEKVPGADSATAASVVAGDVDGKSTIMDDDVDGEPMADELDGEPMEDDVDGMPMEDIDGRVVDEDVDGVPMDEVAEAPVAVGTPAKISLSQVAPPTSRTMPKPSGPKKRMRAEDMFASDED